MSAFAEALALSDLYDPEVTPSGMNSAGPQSPKIPDSDSSSKQLGREAGSALSGAGRQMAARERRSSMASVHGWEKVEKVKALSDFAPIHQKVSKWVSTAPLRMLMRLTDRALEQKINGACRTSRMVVSPRQMASTRKKPNGNRRFATLTNISVPTPGPDLHRHLPRIRPLRLYPSNRQYMGILGVSHLETSPTSPATSP
jgi:hypothetical protein